jgi:hypothetical protein
MHIHHALYNMFGPEPRRPWPVRLNWITVSEEEPLLAVRVRLVRG